MTKRIRKKANDLNLRGYIQRKEVADLYYDEGMHPDQIAERIGISKRTVYYNLEQMDQIWRYDFRDIVAAGKQLAIEFHQNVINEAMQSWYESVGDVESVTVGLDRGQETDLKQTTVSRGDVQYLRTAQASMKEIQRIMGLDAPQKHAVAHHQINYDVDWSKFTPDMLRRVRDDGVSPLQVALESSEYTVSSESDNG